MIDFVINGRQQSIHIMYGYSFSLSYRDIVKYARKSHVRDTLLVNYRFTHDGKTELGAVAPGEKAKIPITAEGIVFDVSEYDPGRAELWDA